MRYVTGNLAESFDERAEAQALPQQPLPQAEPQARPRFDVIEGTRARTSTMPATLQTTLNSVKVIAAYAVVLGLAALTLMGMTHIVLEQDNELSSQISDAQAQAKQLEVQVAVNEDSSRIIEYSTQVYGMVPATDVQTVDVSGEDAAGAQTAEQGAVSSAE